MTSEESESVELEEVDGPIESEGESRVSSALLFLIFLISSWESLSCSSSSAFSKCSSKGKRLLLKIVLLSALIPETLTLASKGSGRGGSSFPGPRPLLESEMRALNLSIFFGLASLEDLSSFALVDRVCKRVACLVKSSR